MSSKLSHALKKILDISNHSIRCKSYKSDLSLDKIYPNSVNIKPFVIPESNGRFSGYIPVEKLTISYCKSSGPGGQHVNKRLTKVDIRFHVQTADWLSEELRQKILEKFPTQINKEGYLVLRSEKTKETLLNRLDVITRLRELIYKADEREPVISEETVEMLNKRKAKAIRMRLMEKRRASLNKKWRSGNIDF